LPLFDSNASDSSLNFGDKPNESISSDSKWSMGLAGGWSKTSASLSGGGYNGIALSLAVEN